MLVKRPPNILYLSSSYLSNLFTPLLLGCDKILKQERMLQLGFRLTGRGRVGCDPLVSFSHYSPQFVAPLSLPQLTGQRSLQRSGQTNYNGLHSLTTPSPQFTPGCQPRSEIFTNSSIAGAATNKIQEMETINTVLSSEVKSLFARIMVYVQLAAEENTEH